LPRHINPLTSAVLFAGNTSILITEESNENLNQKIRFALDCSSRWFKANQLLLNLMKTNILKFSPSHFPQAQLITEHKIPI
jgi:hypothetical protein